MRMFELVLKGFDGGTDATDHKIIWISVPDDMTIDLTENLSFVESVSEFRVKIPSGIDLTVRPIKETDENFYRFRNYYKCPNCNTEWQDHWDSMCNDRCPDCGAEIQPYNSEEI